MRWSYNSLRPMIWIVVVILRFRAKAIFHHLIDRTRLVRHDTGQHEKERE